MAILEMKEIKKDFGGVHALKGVSLTLEKGEVLGLIGENGAGKSTLMKVLAGAIAKDAGQILIDGSEVFFKSPQEALRSGISVIYQELNMVRDVTVAENVFIGHYPKTHGIIDWKKMNYETQTLLDSLHAGFAPTERVGDLSIAQQQLVEIAKALKNQSKIIVFDEPSAVLGKSDSEILFELIRELQQNGIAIIYISHRLDEVLDLSDTIVILRDGMRVATDKTENFDTQRLISEMTGRAYGEMWNGTTISAEDSEVALEIRDLCCAANRTRNASFCVHKGEILGLAGLVGSGRSEIARCIFGINRPDSGQILVNSKPVNILNPKQAMNQGIGFVMEDRKYMGLLLDRPIGENITLTNLKKYAKFSIIDRDQEQSAIKRLKEKLRIKTDDVSNLAKSLSGGNQQKVVLAKWLHIEPDILILDEPTRGVDVGAKAEIYQIIEELRAQGKAILLISSEFQEIMRLSTSIVTIKDGVTGHTYTREQAMQKESLFDTLS